MIIVTCNGQKKWSGSGRWGSEEAGSGEVKRRDVGVGRPGGVSTGGRLQLGDGEGGAGGLGGAAVLQRVLAVAAHTHTRTLSPSPRPQPKPTSHTIYTRSH